MRRWKEKKEGREAEEGGNPGRRKGREAEEGEATRAAGGCWPGRGLSGDGLDGFVRINTLDSHQHSASTSIRAHNLPHLATYPRSKYKTMWCEFISVSASDS
ncbi:hypothetical protein E2C01_005745 [Portunus trituberculatus]|uniref:Uncharacterized protein n=1 Tax=Portunus trituberculatus TaxID=210409 RepID=A0A5B7CT72_PORTR|nr:hypothetical protein [Portunus trituberculatus]